MPPDEAGAPPRPSEDVCRQAIWGLVGALANQGMATDSILRSIADLHTMIENLDRRLRLIEERHR